MHRFCKKLNAIITVRAARKAYTNTIALFMVLRSHVPKNERKRVNGKLQFCAIIDIYKFFNALERKKRTKCFGFCNKCTSYYRDKSHLIKCMTHENPQTNFPTREMYKFVDMQKCLIPECTFYFSFLYGSDSTSTNTKITLNILGFGILGVGSVLGIFYLSIFLSDQTQLNGSTIIFY